MSKTNSDLALLGAVGDQIINLLTDEVFEIDGTPMVTVKQADGGYRKKAMVPGAEFTVTDSYVGKKNNLILIFSPVDAQEITLEIEPKQMDTVFADFGFKLAEAAGLESSEETPKIVNALLRNARAAEKARKAAAEEEQAEQLRSTYTDNPRFGMF